MRQFEPQWRLKETDTLSTLCLLVLHPEKSNHNKQNKTRERQRGRERETGRDRQIEGGGGGGGAEIEKGRETEIMMEKKMSRKR